MAIIKIDDLIFDEYNESEMAAHGITVREARQVFLNGFELLKNANRHVAEYLLVGQTFGGRWITIPIARTPTVGLWRPATAYPSKSAERAKLKGTNDMTINPDEFEAGTNVTARVRSEKSSGMVVSIRLSADDAEGILTLAERSGRSVTDIARQAIRAFVGRGAQAAYTLEVSYGSPPQRTAEETVMPRSDARSERETFGPPVLQIDLVG